MTAGPELVVLVGPAGAGKSTWAAARYRTSQVVSLDALREVVADDENDQDATADAVALLLAIVDARLSRRLTTVVDATNGVAAERAELLAAAGRHQVPAAAVVFGTALETCLARQRHRPLALPGRRWGRAVPDSVVRNQHQRTLDSLATLTTEGFARITTISPLPEGAPMATEISYQTYDAATDTTSSATFTVAHTVDNLGEADRLAKTHAAEHAGPNVDVDVTAVRRSDGRDLIQEWEHTHADVL